MAIDEARRHELHEAVRRTLGESPGDALMELLPPVGWADVATKHDLSELEQRMNLRFEVMETRFEGLEGRLSALIQDKLSAQNRTLLLAAAAAIVASIVANAVG